MPNNFWDHKNMFVFLPKASFGLWVLSLPASVCQSVYQSLACLNPLHLFWSRQPRVFPRLTLLLSIISGYLVGVAWEMLHLGNQGPVDSTKLVPYLRADSMFAPGQWETALLCKAVSNWLGASLESALMAVDDQTTKMAGKDRAFQGPVSLRLKMS